MRDITAYSREEITQSLKEMAAGKKREYGIKILFSPEKITKDNYQQATELFAHLMSANYDTVVILESVDKKLIKKLPMPSVNEFETPLGNVQVNDRMRNEFCDEEDDFFIDDSAFNEKMSLYHQLMMLQCVLKRFNVVSMQISNTESTIIINELVLVLDELLMSRNVLLLICCDMSIDQKGALERMMGYVKNGQKSSLLNMINSHSVMINGKTSFLVGLLVSSTWNVDLHFLNDQYSRRPGNSLIAGFAHLKENRDR